VLAERGKRNPRTRRGEMEDGRKGGWRTGVKGRDVVTNRILPRFFCEIPVTKVVTKRDEGVTRWRRKLFTAGCGELPEALLARG
jgi:hypothetical protein